MQQNRLSFSLGVFDGGAIKEYASDVCATEFALDTPSTKSLEVAHEK